MFGKVAKGLLQGNRRTNEDIGREIEAQLQRIADGILPHDRYEALSNLSDILQTNDQAQRVVGMTGLPVLCSILKEDKDDKEMLRGALECLYHAVALPKPGSQQTASAMNAELFTRDGSNIAAVLDLVSEQGDFYVRYQAVQLLTQLASLGSRNLPQVMLEIEGGVTKLMDLLGDKQEVIRNEGLLLMVALTHAAPHLCRLAAYEGAFENQLAIIRGEGGTEGGIIVQDCFELLNNLLRNSPGNQLIFRESGLLKKLVDLLAKPESYFTRSQPRQRVTNMICLLDTFIILTIQPAEKSGQVLKAQATEEPQRSKNCATLLGSGLLEKLLTLALKGSESSLQPVRNQALLCMAHLIMEFPPGQQGLIRSGLGWQQGTPALRQVLRICLHSPHAAERAAARSVIRAFCLANPEGQTTLASTLTPPADTDARNTTFGGELVKALSQPDVPLGGRAAAVLTSMLQGNPAVKQKLLTIPLQLQSKSEEALLMPCCISHLSNSIYLPGQESPQQAAVFLRLLVSWLTESEPAVAGFLAQPSNLSFIVDIVTGRKGATSSLASALAAQLLGACLVAEQEGGSATTVLDTITTKVGLATYFQKLDAMFADSQFKAAESGPKAPRPATRSAPIQPPSTEDQEAGRDAAAQADGAENPLDHAFAKWALAFRPKIRQHLIGDSHPSQQPDAPAKPRFQPSNGASEPSQLAEAVALIQKLEGELESLKARNRALSQQAIDLQGPSSYPQHMQHTAVGLERNGQNGAAEQRALQAESELSRLRSTNQELEGRHRESQARQHDSEARLREAEQKLSGAAGERSDLEQKLREATRDMEEAQAAASKFEADLEALSQAYTDLETHAHGLEAQIEDSGKAGLNEAATSPANGTKEEDNDQEDSGLDDLLACLGEEEQKVERLSQKLVELGIDPAALLADMEGEDSDDLT